MKNALMLFGMLVLLTGCVKEPTLNDQFNQGNVIEFVMNTAELVGWDSDHITYQADERSPIIHIYGDVDEIQRFRYSMWNQERNFHVIRIESKEGTKYRIPGGVPCNWEGYCAHGNRFIDDSNHPSGVNVMIDNGLTMDGDYWPGNTDLRNEHGELIDDYGNIILEVK